MTTSFTLRNGAQIDRGQLDGLVSQFSHDGTGPANADRTLITWMYRDGANFKKAGAVVLGGAPDAGLLDRLALALNHDEGQPDLITAEVGLGEHIDATQWDSEIDHPFSTITSVRSFCPARDFSLPGLRHDERSLTDFVEAVEAASMDAGWLPSSYAPDDGMAFD